MGAGGSPLRKRDESPRARGLSRGSPGARGLRSRPGAGSEGCLCATRGWRPLPSRPVLFQDDVVTVTGFGCKRRKTREPAAKEAAGGDRGTRPARSHTFHGVQNETGLVLEVLDHLKESEKPGFEHEAVRSARGSSVCRKRWEPLGEGKRHQRQAFIPSSRAQRPTRREERETMEERNHFGQRDPRDHRAQPVTQCWR